MSVLEIECRRCFNKVKVRVDYMTLNINDRIVEKFTAQPAKCECGHRFKDLELAHTIHEYIQNGAIA